MLISDLKDSIDERKQEFRKICGASPGKPGSLEESLKLEFGEEIPVNLMDLFQKCTAAYKKLEEIYAQADAVIADAEIWEETDTDLIDNEALSRLNYLYSDDFLSIQKTCYQLYTNLEIQRNIEYRRMYGVDKILVTDSKKERIILTTPDFSEGFLERFTQPIESLCATFSGALNVDTVNKTLELQGYYLLDNAKTAINEGFYKDYPRQLCALDGKTANYTRNDTKTKEHLDEFVTRYLANVEKIRQNQDPKLLPYTEDQTSALQSGINALLSTLTAQSTLINLLQVELQGNVTLNYNDLKDDQGISHKGIQVCTPLDDGWWIKQSFLSFNEETGKLHIETFLVGDKPSLTGPSVFSNEILTQKIAFDVNTSIDARGNPDFKIEPTSFDLSIIITKSPETRKEAQVIIRESVLKNPEKMDPQRIDSLSPCVENITRFCGYPSLVDFLYESDTNTTKTREKKREEAKRDSKNQLFDRDFIKNLANKNPAEEAFLNQLYTNFYERHVDKAVLVKNIFDFVRQQFPNVSYPDKVRYIYLLKMAEALGATPEEAKAVFTTVLNKSFDSEAGLAEDERKIITGLYNSIYNKTVEKEELAHYMTGLVSRLGTKFENPDANTNKEQYIYFINRAVDYSKYSYAEAVTYLREIFTPQETVEILSRRYDSHQALFEAAKANQDIYREMVEPSWTLSYLFRRFRELLPNALGGIEPRPKFNREEHLDLLAKHSDLLKDPLIDTSNPYQEIRNKYRAELNAFRSPQKLNFLIEHTSDISGTASPKEIARKINNLGEDFFTDLKQYLMGEYTLSLRSIADITEGIPSEVPENTVILRKAGNGSAIAYWSENNKVMERQLSKEELGNLAFPAIGSPRNITARDNELLVTQITSICNCPPAQKNAQQLDHLISKGNPLMLKMFRESPKKSSIKSSMMYDLFRQYVKQGDASLKSVEDRLYKLLKSYKKDPEHIEQRFGKVFIQKLNRNLTALKNDPIKNSTKEFKAICELFIKNPWLYKIKYLEANDIKQFIEGRIKTMAPDVAEEPVGETEAIAAIIEVVDDVEEESYEGKGKEHAISGSESGDDEDIDVEEEPYEEKSKEHEDEDKDIEEFHEDFETVIEKTQGSHTSAQQCVNKLENNNKELISHTIAKKVDPTGEVEQKTTPHT